MIVPENWNVGDIFRPEDGSEFVVMSVSAGRMKVMILKWPGGVPNTHVHDSLREFTVIGSTH